MLVLQRKFGERIMIGEDITIQVVMIKDGKVRLGITAPEDLPVHREEIYKELKREEREREAGADEDPR